MISPHRRSITEQHWRDAQLIWDYHQVGHELSPCDAAIDLGSHDLGVAAYAAELYHAGLFTVLVFSGANSPTTAQRFPRGEAVHYREHAIELGVPDKLSFAIKQNIPAVVLAAYDRLLAAGFDSRLLRW